MRTIQTVLVTALLAGALPLSIQAAVLNNRIDDLEQQRTIYASRAENWTRRAIDTEAALENLQAEITAAPVIQLTQEAETLPEGMTAEYAGEFFCTAYCAEKYKHICGTGTGITASGAPVEAGVTVAADQSIFEYGTVLYIEGVGIRIVQDKGGAVQGTHLDIAVDTHANAESWTGYGNHKVWILKETS